ncbi:MAG: hypothetical protein AB8G18_09925 [Gammaproteobacteria bacterium]
MSWQKCDNAESYSLSVPALVTLTLGALHLWLGLSVLVLELPSEAIAMLWLLLLRSWIRVRRNAHLAGSLALSLDARDRLLVNEVSRTNRCKPDPDRERAWSTICTQNGTNEASRNLLYVDGVRTQHQGHTREQQYTCCRSVKMPGCIYMDLLDDYGKRLEILIFYRYHQREFYLRLLRHLAIK